MNKANERAAKKYGYMSNVAQIQKQLYDEGYYDKGTTLEQAVDGVMGSKTRQALERKRNHHQQQIKPLNLQEAQQQYQNQNGLINSGISYLYHVIMPQSSPMPHASKLKDQMAAAVAYDVSDQGFKEKRKNGQNMIGYKTYGKLSGQSPNVNEQKIMLRVKLWEVLLILLIMTVLNLMIIMVLIYIVL